MEKEHNPITMRLEKLEDLWLDSTASQAHQMCRWLIETDELQMIEAFYKTQNSGTGKCNDLFLKFETPFMDAHDYGSTLSTELVKQVNENKAELETSGAFAGWQPTELSEDFPSWVPFFYNLGTFVESITGFPGKIVAYLSPQKVANTQGFEAWLAEALTYSIPPRTHIMLADSAARPLLDSLAQSHPQNLKTLIPELDMPTAMLELASQGDNPDEPGLQFRIAFMHLSQAVAANSEKDVQQYAEVATGIAAKQKWNSMQAAVKMLLGKWHFDNQRYAEALETYGEARAITENADEAIDPACASLALQCDLMIGTVYDTAGQPTDAAEEYEFAANTAAMQQDHYYVMESQRLAGDCYAKAKDYPAAWESYQAAVAAAKEVKEDIRPNTPLPLVGKALLHIAPKVKQKAEIPFIRQQMETYLGPDWEHKTF